MTPGADARYEIDEELSLSDVAPMIAKPFSPGNAFPAEDVARERITFDKALIGSCTNGSYDDLLQAALVIYHARRAGLTKAAAALVVFPGIRRRWRGRSSGPIRGSAANRSPRCSAPSAARSASRGAGPASARARTRCSPASARSRRSIATGRTAWASAARATSPAPPIVAASALAGYMAPPSELGLTWDPELYGI